MIMEVLADFQKKSDQGNDDKIICLLCPHRCRIGPGEKGICRVRKNIDGKLYSINYGEVSSAGVDPIEKKPLYHFYPGSKIFSLGTFGCNFSCDFCQNWSISQKKPDTKKLVPEDVIELAEKKGVTSIAYTYSEPIVWYEFIYQTSKLAHEKGFKNVLVTNGYINPDPLEKLIPYIDAANVDLKSFGDNFYKEFAGGSLEPVKSTIQLMEEKIHLEVTNLIINGLNDDEAGLEEIFSWLGGLNRSIPLHLSRYFPAYKMKRSATEISTMEKAYDIAQKYLDYIYLGNMQSDIKNNTYCPECGKELISRNYFQADCRIGGSDCPFCGKEVYGRFKRKKEQGS